MTKRRVLLACDLDSQVFGALPLALAFAARGWDVTFAIESAATLPQLIVERLTRDFSIIERSIGALPADEDTFRHHAVGVFVTGSRLALFRHTLELSARIKMRPRPALFCGFNGLVFEKFEEGLAWRLGYDVIGLNGPRDRDAFVDFLHATEFSRQPSVIVGLRRKTDTPPRPLKIPAPESEPDAPPLFEEKAAETAPVEAAEAPSMQETPSDAPETTAEPAPVDLVETAAPPLQPTAEKQRKLFVFAEQVVVPKSLRERQNLVATLARLAQASPDWDVVIKARVKPDEKTFHQQPNHISTLVKEVRKRPRNLKVLYEPLDELLDRADLFATVSSTALFDAFDYGVPSMVATDFGLRNADGAHVFFASGLLVRLSDLPSLDEAPIRAPDERWMRRMGYGAPFSPGALVDWLEAFDPSRPMPQPFVSFVSAAHVATNNPALATEICALYETVKDFGRDGVAETDDAAANARATLFKIASLIRAALAPKTQDKAAGKEPPKPPKKETPPPPASKKPSPAPAKEPVKTVAPIFEPEERREGPVASFSRKLGMYWFYKRVRKTIGVPVR